MSRPNVKDQRESHPPKIKKCSRQRKRAAAVRPNGRHSLKSQTGAKTSCDCEQHIRTLSFCLPHSHHPSSSPPLLPSTFTTYEFYYLVCVSGLLSAPVPVVLVLFLFCEGASDSFYHSNPSSLTRNPCDTHRDLSPNSVSFISHIFSTPCPKFKTDRLRAAEYPPGVAVAASAPEVVVVVAADLRMPTTQRPHHLKRVKLVR